jgi:signal transduction histidine kinase
MLATPALLALLAAAPAHALDPATPLRDFHHTIWTSKDGAPAEITSMAQTPDGWLWLGTPTGIYRFDGVRFEPYVPPPGSKLAHSRISELLVLPNGDLLIGYIWLGLSVRYADGRFEHLAQAGDQVRQVLTMTRDVDGSLWVATVTAVRRLAEGRWQTIGAESGVTGVARSVLADQHGQLYLSTDKGTLRLNRATRRFEPTDDKPNTMLVQSPDGRLWGGGDDNLHQVPTAAPRMPRPDWMNQAEGHAAGIFDRDGNLWALRCPIGLCVVRGADRLGDHLVPSRDATDRFDQPWQLGNLSTNLLLEDPLGNIWLSTQAGLERFRNSAMLPARVGGADGFYVLTRGIGGDVWVSDRRKHNVWLMASGQPPKRHDEYQYVAAGRDGGLLLATSDYLERRQGERVERLAWPTGSGKVSTHAIFDDGRYIWARINGASFVLVDGQWRKRSEVMSTGYSHYAVAGVGKVWFVSSDGLISQFDNGKVLATWKPEQHGITAVSGVFAGNDTLAAGENGLAVLRDGQWHKLTAAQPAVLTNVTGVTIAANGDRWINGMRGVLHVTQADWQRAIAQPAQPLRYDLFDATDGYIGEATTGVWDNTALTDGNGQLWFASTTGLYRLDPAKLWRHKSTPRAEILLLQAAQAHAPHSGLRLAPGTSQLRLDYTGLGSGKPEKLRFQYRLDGIDQDWQDADTRRSVYYTNLGPGDFRFHLRAVNEDGIWSKEESLSFSVEPTVVQSVWFKLALALLAAALLYLLYRQRLRINTRRALERFNLRVEERESIARDLHDTLLQSMQGVIYSVKAMAMDLPPQEPMRRAMDRTVKLATDALVEGRDRVSELRAEAATRLNLSDALQAIAAEHAGVAPQIAVRSEGAPRELHPVVHDELLLMGRECLLNAIRHAQASEVKVVLQWGERTLKLVVSDNGVGMPAEVAATQSKPGHWGLEGLHERAHRLQAVLGLETGAGGTEWTISVPAVLAYRRRASEAEA